MHQQTSMRLLVSPLKSNVGQCYPVTASIPSGSSFIFHCCFYQYYFFRERNPVTILTNRVIQAFSDPFNLLRLPNSQTDEIFSFSFGILKTGCNIKRSPVTRIMILNRYQAFSFFGRGQPKIDCIYMSRHLL